MTVFRTEGKRKIGIKKTRANMQILKSRGKRIIAHESEGTNTICPLIMAMSISPLSAQKGTCAHKRSCGRMIKEEEKKISIHIICLDGN